MQDFARLVLNRTANSGAVAQATSIEVTDDGRVYLGDTCTFEATFETGLTAEERHDIGTYCDVRGDQPATPEGAADPESPECAMASGVAVDHDASLQCEMQSKTSIADALVQAIPEPSKSDEELKAFKQSVRCLALNIYHEARSESEVGQMAIAAVTLNRVASKSFPNSVCAVVEQGGQQRHRCQFSWWCDGKADAPTEKDAWQKALRISRLSLDGEASDPTGGALYYHTTSVNPEWSQPFKRTTQIGEHVFLQAGRDANAAFGRSELNSLLVSGAHTSGALPPSCLPLRPPSPTAAVKPLAC